MPRVLTWFGRRLGSWQDAGCMLHGVGCAKMQCWDACRADAMAGSTSPCLTEALPCFANVGDVQGCVIASTVALSGKALMLSSLLTPMRALALPSWGCSLPGVNQRTVSPTACSKCMCGVGILWKRASHRHLACTIHHSDRA